MYSQIKSGANHKNHQDPYLFTLSLLGSSFLLSGCPAPVGHNPDKSAPTRKHYVAQVSASDTVMDFSKLKSARQRTTGT